MLTLPDEILESIFHSLAVPEILCSMRTCTHWQTLLQREAFWKKYIYQHFNLQENPHGPKENDFLRGLKSCLYYDPFPVALNCGILIPPEFKVLEDCSSFKNLARALYILTKLKKECDSRKLIVETPRSEENSMYFGDIGICLFPWDQDVLPSAIRIIKILHAVDPGYLSSVASYEITWNLTDNQCADTFDFHENDWSCETEGIVVEDSSDSDDNDDDSEDDNSDKDKQTKIKKAKRSPMSRSFKDDTERKIHFGIRPSNDHLNHIGNPEGEDQFHLWLDKVYHPSIHMYAGEETHSGGANYYFHLTRVAPGYLGGVISGVRINSPPSEDISGKSSEASE